MTTLNSAVQYRDVANFAGYRIGSDGTIWSRRPRNGMGPLLENWRLLKSRADKWGYLYVCLGRGSGQQSTKFIHRLVIEAFVGSCPSGMQCCHNDGNHANNRLENLRWGSPKENADDRNRHGTGPQGEGNGNSKLTETDVIAIRIRNAAGESQTSLAREFGVTQVAVSSLVRGKAWTHVSAPAVSIAAAT